jgi:hypothetical protein
MATERAPHVIFLTRLGPDRPCWGQAMAARSHLRLAATAAGSPAPAEPVRSSFISDELLEELRGGARTAERAFVAHFWPRVSRTLSHLLGAVHEIEDLTQEVFIRVFSRLDSDPRRGERAAVRHVDDGLRRPGGAATQGATPLARVLGARGRSGDRDAGRIGRGPARGSRSFTRSSASCRSTNVSRYRLRHVEGMELTELAWATATSLSTAKRRLRAAEARFTKLAAGQAELADLLQEGRPMAGARSLNLAGRRVAAALRRRGARRAGSAARRQGSRRCASSGASGLRARSACVAPRRSWSCSPRASRPPCSSSRALAI